MFNIEDVKAKEILPLPNFGFKEKAITSSQFYIQWIKTHGAHKVYSGIENEEGEILMADYVGIQELFAATKDNITLPMSITKLKDKSPAFITYPELRGFDETKYWQAQRGYQALDIIHSLNIETELDDNSIRKALLNRGYTIDILRDSRLVKPFGKDNKKLIETFPNEAKNKLRLVNILSHAIHATPTETLEDVSKLGGNEITVAQYKKAIEIAKEVDGGKSNIKRVVELAKQFRQHQYTIHDDAYTMIEEIKVAMKLNDDGQVIDKAIRYYYKSKEWKS